MEKNSWFLNLPTIEPSLILLSTHHSGFYNWAFPFLGVRQSRLFSTRVCNLASPYPEYPSLWVYNQAFPNSEYPSPWVYNWAFSYPERLSPWFYKELYLIPSTHYPGFTIGPSLIPSAYLPGFTIGLLLSWEPITLFLKKVFTIGPSTLTRILKLSPVL